MFDKIAKVASKNVVVLLRGATGVGKTHTAKEIHDLSKRTGAFVAVHCPNISKELGASEIFGHVKGAFTGAVADTWGKVAAAARGTLFLDEIADLDLGVQAMLLSYIETQEYHKVGSAQVYKSDTRIIVATNKDLEKLVEQGLFRGDLYQRIKTFTFKIPNLASRGHDFITTLADELLTKANNKHGTTLKFSPSCICAMGSAKWEGNIRELKNAIEYAVVMAEGNTITEKDFPPNILTPCSVSDAPRLFNESTPLLPLETIRSQYIEYIVSRYKTSKDACNVLGIDPATLYRYRKQLAQPQPA